MSNEDKIIAAIDRNTEALSEMDKQAIMRGYYKIMSAVIDGTDVVTNCALIIKMHRFCMDSDVPDASVKVLKKWRDIEAKIPRATEITVEWYALPTERRFYAAMSDGSVMDCAILAMFEGCTMVRVVTPTSQKKPYSDEPVIFLKAGNFQGAAMAVRLTTADLRRGEQPTRTQILETVSCAENGWYGASRELLAKQIVSHQEEISRLESIIADEIADERAAIAVLEKRMEELVKCA